MKRLCKLRVNLKRLKSADFTSETRFICGDDDLSVDERVYRGFILITSFSSDLRLLMARSNWLLMHQHSFNKSSISTLCLFQCFSDILQCFEKRRSKYLNVADLKRTEVKQSSRVGNVKRVHVQWIRTKRCLVSGKSSSRL